MKPNTEHIGNDPTILGNERPRRDLDDDSLPEGEEVQEEDPRNGMNRPVDDTVDRSKEDKDEE